MVLDDSGLKINAFEPALAVLLGDARGEEGAQVLSETVAGGRTRVEIRDFVYCLTRASTTLLHKQFLERAGQDADTFVDTIDGGLDDAEANAGEMPLRMTSICVHDDVAAALADAEASAGAGRIGETHLTRALLAHADPTLRGMLAVWLREDRFETLLRRLDREVARPAAAAGVFDADGVLLASAFDAGGRRFLNRLLEDAASLGARRITARHLLYSLLGDERGPLAHCLFQLGCDVVRTLQAPLARQLSAARRRRNDALALRRDHLLATARNVLEHALALATGADGSIGTVALTRAFVARQPQEVDRMLRASPGIDRQTLVTMLEEFEDEPEQEADPATQRLPIAEIERRIRHAIRGQDHAIAQVLPWIKRLRFGIPRDGRPAGVFLLLGPTGTGKTQLAKELARYVYGEEEALIYLEMGQFKTKESMNMFIGASPGYVGYGEGKLTNGLRDKPQSVVLFDEIEKADTEVFDALLRFADEGMISDPAGPVRDGRKCLVVMTTNAGQRWLRDELRNVPGAVDNPKRLAERLFEAAMEELASRGFRPEFLGRIDQRITYLPLGEQALRGIVDLVLARELAKFDDYKDVHIEVDASARDVLVSLALQRSLDEGARGVPRAINEWIVTPAIDLLSDREDHGTPIASTRLIATAHGLAEITMEVSG